MDDQITSAEYIEMVEGKKKARRGKSVSANPLNNSVIELVTLRGGMAWRSNAGSIRVPYTRKGDGVRRTYSIKLAPPGSGDVLALYRGVFVSFETKTPGDEMRASQVAWNQQVLRHGGRVAEVRDVLDAVKVLDEIDEENHSLAFIRGDQRGA